MQVVFVEEKKLIKDVLPEYVNMDIIAFKDLNFIYFSVNQSVISVIWINHQYKCYLMRNAVGMILLPVK